MLVAGSIIFFAPLLVAIAIGYVLPDQIRLYGIILAYLFASVVAVSVASEHYHGRICSADGLLTSVRDGARAAGWIGLAVGGVIAAAWMAAQMT
ncbi:phosphoribosylformylglycinamidine synthase [Pseudomonas sp. MT-1]|uniref:hypothetical protein n=1 Tax=Stutzerimonas stutzeri TaxID=316 RepID=UPI0005363EEE|nr:hypothetical protein [Stutzerimonas stutzeri]MCQ4282547.1 hypothetical protein [Stutzerimonas stutzeri]BAP80897.1 phosphoribosylformylglycinamidine synthase [Pseudomonas sp. MT-1]